MSEEIKCPVCGKAGIQDYHSEDIICPCCGSDLSIYQLIDQIPEKSGNKSSLVWKSVAGIACVAAIVLSFTIINNRKEYSYAKTEYAQLQDSVVVLNGQIVSLNDKLKNASANTPVVVGHKYVVRKGDSLWKISSRLFGTGTKYKEIASWNNIDVAQPSITPGDTLIIK